MEFNIGQRILYNGERCTVRFIGHIDEWGEDTKALGIEFDIDVPKGKNLGLGYFKTYMNLKQGLFCKINEKLKQKVEFGIEFERALYFQYSNIKITWNGEQVKLAELDPHIEFNTKVVEKYGFDDLCEHNANFKNLSTLSLESMKISTFYISHSIPLSLPSLINLDLSRNLFISFNSLMEHISRISPNLETLNLTCNNFSYSTSELSSNFSLQNLKILNLTSCCISKDLLFSIMSPKLCLSSLEELNLTNNFIKDDWFDICNKDFSKLTDQFEPNNNLRVLNLSNNCLNNFPWSIFKILPRIENLDISANRISIIPEGVSINNYNEETPYVINLDLKDFNEETFSGIKSLNLNYNNLQLLDLDIINCKFPGLLNLQINYNLKMIKQIIDQGAIHDDLNVINQKIMKLKDIIKYDTDIHSNNYAEILHLSENRGVNKNIDVNEIDDIINYELFVNTIYRFQKGLKKLNKSPVSKDRKNSELYFVSKFQRLSNLRFSNYNIRRFNEICLEYNRGNFSRKVEPFNSGHNNKIRKLKIPGFGIFESSMLNLNIVYNSDVVPVNIFENSKVNELKAKVKVLFKIHSILNIHLSYSLNDNNVLQDLNNNEAEISIYNIPNNTYVNFNYIDIAYQ